MISCQRHLFNIPNNIHYFNSAAMTPGLKTAIEAGHKGISVKEQPWTFDLSMFFERPDKLRGLFGQLIGVDIDHIALVPTVSRSLDDAVRLMIQDGLEGGDVLILQDQYPSNVYPWMRLCETRGGKIVTVPRPDDWDWTTEILKHIDKNIKVAALPACHWLDGSTIDLVKITNACRDVGARIVLDLTQSLGASPFSNRGIDADFVVSSGWKWLFGPYPGSYMYVHPKYHGYEPGEQTYISRDGAEKFSSFLDYPREFRKGARRFDAGGAARIHTLPIAIEGLTQLLEWKPENISATIEPIVEKVALVAETKGWHVIPEQFRASHMIGLGLPKGLEASVFMEKAVAQNIYLTARGGRVRIAPHVYNNEEDVNALLGLFNK